MDSTELLFYQLFGASVTVGLIKCLIQVLTIALGVYLGNRWSAHRAQKINQQQKTQ